MNVEIGTAQVGETGMVWKMIERIALSDLDFPEVSLQHYRQGLSDDEILRRIRDPRHVLLVARQDGGFAGLLVGTPPEGGVGTIIWLLVVPECRNEHIGGRLFEEACRRYKAMDCHKLKLTAPTQAARQFYEKQGMTVEGFHPDHWFHISLWSLGMNLVK